MTCEETAMAPEELATYLSSLEAAADVVEAIDDPETRRSRGWNLAGWSYELIPWGVRFVHSGQGPRTEVAVLAGVRAVGPRVHVAQSSL